MAQIIYGKKVIDKSGTGITDLELKEIFSQAVSYNRRLRAGGQRVAYCFIDPLMHAFEAANHFYFSVMECQVIGKLNSYRTGASPIHALHDARLLVDHGLYDAVFIFGYEPLQSNRKRYGREAVMQAMDIFKGINLLSCYNGLAQLMCKKLGMSERDFIHLADLLYENYSRTYLRLHPQGKLPPRGPFMAEAGAPLFRLTDCANPNLDFAAGIIVASPQAADTLGVPAARRLDILSTHSAMVEASPHNLAGIVGGPGRLFPHLQQLFVALQQESGLNPVGEWQRQNLLLDVYTCYPPIPLAFLLVGGFATSIEQLAPLLAAVEITTDGGLNLGGAPWNNPVLASLADMPALLAREKASLALVHGNGGIGEAQALALLQKGAGS